MEKSETLESQPGPAKMLHGKPLILVFWISQNKTDDLVEFSFETIWFLPRLRGVFLVLKG